MKGNKDKTCYSENKGSKKALSYHKKVVFHDLKTEKMVISAAVC
jgi:hypothetical protein